MATRSSNLSMKQLRSFDMKKQILLAIVVLLYITSVSNAQRSRNRSMTNTLAAREKTLWEAWKNKQAGPFEAALAPDTIMVSEMGPTGKADLVKMIPTAPCDIQSYELSDFK